MLPPDPSCARPVRSVLRCRRRRFLELAGGGAAAAALGPIGRAAASPGGADLLARRVRANDARIPALLERQETGASHPWVENSKVSQAIANNPTLRLREELGTEPSVYYIPPAKMEA